MTKPKQPAGAKPRKPVKMWTCAQDLDVLLAEGLSNRVLMTKKKWFDYDFPILIFDLSPASVEALTVKLATAQYEITTGEIATSREVLDIEYASRLIHALGFPTSRKARNTKPAKPVEFSNTEMGDEG